MRYAVIGTAGHIDHGKSTLVRALTGIDPDRLKEERERGITIDLGFAHLIAGDVTLAFVDVPGHERFVKNMLAGATGTDAVLLVVAANESVMPQTREHFDICRLLQLRRGVICLTKADLVDAETLALVMLEVGDLVAGSFLATAPVVAVSSVTGHGLDALRQALLEVVGVAAGRRVDAPFRMPIDRAFSVKGFGTVVTGTVVSGRGQPDDTLALLPRGDLVKVRSWQGHGATLPVVVAGQRGAANLAGVEVHEVARGDCLVCPDTYTTTKRVDVSLELLSTAKPLKHGARIRFHHGTAETLGRVALAGRPPGDADGSAPLEIRPGATAYARVRLERPIVVTRGDRFVVRAYSPVVTVAGGVVLDPHPARTAIRTAAGFARLSALDAPTSEALRAEVDIDRAVMTFVEELGSTGLAGPALVSRAGLTRAEAAATVARLDAAGLTCGLAEVLVARRVWNQAAQSLVALLAEYHATQPTSDGMPREEVRARLFRRAAPSLFDAVLAGLVDGGVVQARDRLALTSHASAVRPATSAARDSVAAALRGAGLQPPDTSSLCADLGLPAATLEQVLRLLQRQGLAARLDAHWFHAEALEKLKADVRAMPGGRFDVALFKQRFGVTRKYAIPLLEYLDRERITRRAGDSRMVL